MEAKNSPTATSSAGVAAIVATNTVLKSSTDVRAVDTNARMNDPMTKPANELIGKLDRGADSPADAKLSSFESVINPSSTVKPVSIENGAVKVSSVAVVNALSTGIKHASASTPVSARDTYAVDSSISSPIQN